KDGRLDEEAFAQARALRNLAAADERRAVLFANVNVAHHVLKLILVHERADLCIGARAVAKSEFDRALDDATDELVRDLVNDNCAARRRAALPRRAERALRG